MEQQDRKNFWMTLPGLMTGVASLLTALMALMAFINGGGNSKNKCLRRLQLQFLN